MEDFLTKDKFLEEHNKLSPNNLQVTFALLTKFQEEKKPLLKDKEWSNKLRMPLISWILTLPKKEKRTSKKAKEEIYRDYPQTKL